jgi:hypothetical protein
MKNGTTQTNNAESLMKNRESRMNNGNSRGASLFAGGCLALMVSFSGGNLAAQEEPAVGAPYSPYPSKVVATKVTHFGIPSWKIATAGGTWYFEAGGTEAKGSTGFSSAFDQAGNDWIGNDKDKGFNKSPSFGGKHDYRGFPQFGSGPDFDHPARPGSKGATKWVNEKGEEIEFKDKLEGDHLILRSFEPRFETEYHFFASHAAIKVIKADAKYCFLYEGPIGGEQEKPIEKDYYVLKDGKARQLNRTAPTGALGYIDPEFTGGKFPSPYFYFVDADPKDTQIMYVGAKNLEPATYGDEGWMQCQKDQDMANMVIFSFGRAKNQRVLTGTNAVCVFGFLPKGDHAKIDKFIEEKLASPFAK